MKDRFVSLIVTGLLIAVLSGQAGAQLLFKHGEAYTNYAFEGYRAYESLIFGRTRSPQFDNLGQFVMNGVSVYELNEYRTIDPVSGSIITKPSLYDSYLNRLVISGLKKYISKKAKLECL